MKEVFHQLIVSLVCSRFVLFVYFEVDFLLFGGFCRLFISGCLELFWMFFSLYCVCILGFISLNYVALGFFDQMNLNSLFPVDQEEVVCSSPCSVYIY